jgi:hypothetical protein
LSSEEKAQLEALLHSALNEVLADTRAFFGQCKVLKGKRAVSLELYVPKHYVKERVDAYDAVIVVTGPEAFSGLSEVYSISLGMVDGLVNQWRNDPAAEWKSVLFQPHTFVTRLDGSPSRKSE